jgi:uncharacterized surface protein with fasciclin (FAS1) repeats
MRLVFNSIRVMALVGLITGIFINVNALAGGHKAAAPATPDIVDTAVAAGSFSTLVAALQQAELVDALKAKGPYTVFAPNDYAFSKLWEGTIDNLMKPENKAQLLQLLKYHVVPGKIMSSDLSGTVNAETLEGGELKIVATDKIMVNGSTVIQADIETSNGVIHVIDAVLIPVN